MSSIGKIIAFIMANWEQIWEIIKDLKEIWDKMGDDEKTSLKLEAKKRGNRSSLSMLEKYAEKAAQSK